MTLFGPNRPLKSLTFAMLLAAQPAAAAITPPMPVEMSVCFSPGGDCVEDIVAAFDGAERTIRVQAMNFSRQGIADALIRARERGVDVEVIFDDRQQTRLEEPGACAEEDRDDTVSLRLMRAGIPVWIDAGVETAHNKVAIIDGALVIGGSYNYTYSAERRNAENVTFVWSGEMAGLYADNWLARRAASVPFRPPEC